MSGVAPGPPVLVTGATGFLGAHAALTLLGKGFRVRALARRSSDLQQAGDLGVEVVLGDLSDLPSVVAATAGQRVVVHAAGRVSDWGPREAFWRANVEGTANLVAACQASGVARLVHVSSLTVLGLPRDGRVVDETSQGPSRFPGDFYSESKAAGERLVREAHGCRGLATTVVRPGAIWGPGDTNVLPRVVSLLRRGAMPYVKGGANLLGLSHVENLCEGIALAATSAGAAGQLYHLTDGEEVSARQAFDVLAAALGVRRPRVSVPFWAIHGLAAVVEGAARLLRRASPPPLARYGVRFVACDARYDIGKARRELGYSPAVSFRDGVAGLALAAAGSGTTRPRAGAGE